MRVLISIVDSPCTIAPTAVYEMKAAMIVIGMFTIVKHCVMKMKPQASI